MHLYFIIHRAVDDIFRAYFGSHIGFMQKLQKKAASACFLIIKDAEEYKQLIYQGKHL